MKILHVVSALDNGGVERMLYNYLSDIEKKDLQFDFIVHEKKEGKIEKKLKEKGCIIYHVKPKKESILKNLKQIRRIIVQGNYDVVHCHQNFSSFTTLWIAKRNHVKIRIVHSHGCKPSKSWNGKAKEKIFRKLNKWNANYFFACGEDAAKWLYGNDWKENEKHIIMPNAIEVESFRYSPKAKENKKQKVLLHIGRFSPEKNQIFLVELMEYLKQKGKSQYKLILVGEGSTKAEIQKKVKEKNMEENIHFLGTRDDIGEIMSMSDIFLLPSKHEGFPVTVIEAQANGIPIICSENVPREVKLTNLVQFVTIQSIEEWGKEIEQIKIISTEDRVQYNEMLKNTIYNIKNQSIKYLKWLKEIEKEVNK